MSLIGNLMILILYTSTIIPYFIYYWKFLNTGWRVMDILYYGYLWYTFIVNCMVVQTFYWKQGCCTACCTCCLSRCYNIYLISTLIILSLALSLGYIAVFSAQVIWAEGTLFAVILSVLSLESFVFHLMMAIQFMIQTVNGPGNYY